MKPPSLPPETDRDVLLVGAAIILMGLLTFVTSVFLLVGWLT